MKLSDLPVLKVEYLMTRDCQLNCGYCKITDKRTLRGKEMSTRRVLNMVDMVGEEWPGAPIIFFGGEPTLRDDLPDAILRCVERGVKHAVISNSVRMLSDKDFRTRLVNSGLSNWSVSFDADTKELNQDKSTFMKSSSGLKALKLMRDEYGIRDLVTCITVTKKNIRELPRIIEMLTSEGIWSICTPLQVGGKDYAYSKGRIKDIPCRADLVEMVPLLETMVESGKYLMHNSPGWFTAWLEHFRWQDWFCHDKSNLTVDADGSLRYCVDIALPEGIKVWDLKDGNKLEQYAGILEQKPECSGCIWDPAYESINRALDPSVGIERGRKSFRHELTQGEISNLIPEAQRWFNPLSQG